MKKRVLYITINKILENSGGGVGARRIYNSLKNIKQEGNIDFKVISLDNNLPESIDFIIDKDKKDDVISRLCLHSNYMYTQLKKNILIDEIKEYKPDIVFISSSRLGFVAKKLRKNNINNIIGFFDNIEFDYVDAYALKFSGIKKKLFKLIEKSIVYRDEKDFLKNIDSGIFLTQRDRLRSEDLYKIKLEKNINIPICVSNFNSILKKTDDINLVFMGSLSYGSNIDAIEYFIDNIWEDIQNEFDNIKFVVAGGNPPQSLVDKIKKYKNISLKANFKNKEDVVNNKSIFISPIRMGAGMKVKVAEALSMGLPIVGSTETLVGYEEVLTDKSFVFEANNKEQYIECINKIKNNDFECIKNTNLDLYQKYYSEDRIKKDIINIINSY